LGSEVCSTDVFFLLQLIAKEANCEPGEICDFELQLCDTQPSVVAGATEEFIFSGRLDNLCMSFCSLKVCLADSFTYSYPIL
jgi:aspartyl aminopeptidase